jgi:hypothetical protein
VTYLFIIREVEDLHSANDRPERHHPYGEGPALLGLRAADLLGDLCDVPAWTKDQRWRWVNSDRFALYGWYSLEIETLDALAEPELTRNQVGDILNHLSDFRVALPFSEAEGNWLLDAYSQMFDTSANLSFIRSRKPEEIVSAGLRRVIDGRDLLRRWWAWRREADEFRGQGSIYLAREALRTLIETVAPYHDLPKGYEALQATSDK